MNPRGSGQSYGPSSADAYQLELDQAVGSPGSMGGPRVEYAQPAQTGSVNADPAECAGDCTEFNDAHVVLDALGAGDRHQPLADRIRAFIGHAAGERAAAALNPDFGAALARYHLERSGHPEACPCNPCRQARLIR